MAFPIIMPKQGLQMTEGTIIKWLKKEGEVVKEGEPLFEMETDKLTITIDSSASGTLLKIVHGADDVVPITEVIAYVGEPGEAIPDGGAPAAAAPAEAPAASAAPAAPAAPAVDTSNINASVVIMPKQGLQMTEGTIIKWLKKEGEAVKEGEPLFEMETDKLTITIDATATGTLLKIVRGEGDVVPITETIAIIGEPGTDITPLLPQAAAPAAAEPASAEPAVAAAPAAAAAAPAAAAVNRAPGERVFATPRARMRAEERGIPIEAVAGTGPDGLIIERDVLNANVNVIKATPVAKKIAELEGVDLASVSGTGVNGKIMKSDVLSAVADAAAPQAAAAAVEQAETVVPFAGMRKAIANNMSRSLTEMAQANHRMKVDMTESVRFRNKLKEADIKVSFTDILAKAVAAALIQFPNVNSTLDGQNIIMKHYVNLGIAVALDNGLIVPNIKNAHTLSVTQIHEQVAALAAKAKDGKLTRDEYANGTFTITNLGMYDVDEFTAVINPPEAAILAVGKITDTPVVVDGKVEIRPIMTLSLTYDHRIIDGAPAAQFLQYVKKLLQNPYLML